MSGKMGDGKQPVTETFTEKTTPKTSGLGKYTTIQ